MEVALLTPAAPTLAGLNRYGAGLLSGLRSIGVEVQAIPIRKTEVGWWGKPVLGNTSLRLRAWRATRRLEGEADVFHGAEPNLASGTQVVTVHDTIFLRADPSYLPRAIARSYHQSMVRRLRTQHVVCPTRVVRDELLQLGFREDRVTVTSEGVDPSIFHPDDPHPGMAGAGFHILLVGDLNPRKKWDLVLRAAQELPSVHVWHAGPINQWTQRWQEVSRVAATLGPRWHPLGSVSDEELRSLYSACDLFCLLSQDEGFGLPPIEAMACGAPVLVNDIPVFHETLEGVARFCQLSAAAVGSAIRQEMEEGPVAGQDRRLRHAAAYTWEATARRTVEAYRVAMEDVG